MDHHASVHSNFTLNLGRKTNPVSSGTAKLDPGEFNTFGLEWFPDKLVFTILRLPAPCGERCVECPAGRGIVKTAICALDH